MGGFIILLAFCSSCLSTALPVEKSKDEHLSTWHVKDDGDIFNFNKKDILDVLVDDDDDDDGWRKIFPTREPSEDWNRWDRFTVPPLVDDDDDDGWRKIFPTREPSDDSNRWVKYTLPPRTKYDYVLRNDDTTGVYFAVFVIVFIIIVAISACLKYACEVNADTSTVSTYDRLATPNSQHSASSQRSPVSTISRSNTSDRPLIIIEFVNEMSEPNDFISTIDQPPRYDDVVQSDLSGTGTFPEIPPSVPDSPPPAYEEGNFVRY